MQVYANDLNPSSYQYLCTNIRLNKVGTRVHPFNVDGREFIRLAAGGRLGVPQEGNAAPAASSEPDRHLGQPFHHVVMNLPASAVEFLDALDGSFDPANWHGHELPLVHVYTFCRANESQAGEAGRPCTAPHGHASRGHYPAASQALAFAVSHST